MKTNNNERRNYNEIKRKDRVGRFALGCVLIVVPYLGSQSFAGDILGWLGAERLVVLGIQVAGAVLFSAFSVLLTKDFNLFYKWLNNHQIIKTITGFIFYCNCIIVWWGYGLVLKTIFIIGKHPEECKEIDAVVKQKIKEYKTGSALIKAGMSAVLVAAEVDVVIIIWGVHSYEKALTASHILNFLASIMGLIVVLSAMWERVQEDARWNRNDEYSHSSKP